VGLIMFWGKKENNIEFEKDITEEEILFIINHFADGLLVFDRNSNLCLINPKAEDLLEVKKEKVLGRQILTLNSFPNFGPLISLLGGGMKEVSRQELQVKENFILEITAIPMIIKGNKIGSLVILHDVTRERLVDKMKSEFVTLAAHQLRTPASAVKWALRTLLEGDLGELNKKQKEMIEEAYITNDRAIKLVNDLLNVAQIEEGKYLSKITLSSIENVIQSVVDNYGRKIKEKKLKVGLKKSKEELAAVMLDVTKMETAIRNIFDNAVRYTPSGGKISIVLKKHKEEIEVQIQDTGLGIPLYQQEKVFTKFFRGANIIKVDTEGTGLGLYITKNIIEAHGGRIWFKSEEGKGTTFYFTIPIKEKFGEFLTEEFY